MKRIGYKKREKGVPVQNKETGRTVYVLPETLEKAPNEFTKLPSNHVGDPRWRGKAKPPRKPSKPHKPEIPRDPPPTVIREEQPKQTSKVTNPVTPVHPVKPMKVPEPSPKRKWKKLKKFSPTVTASTVLQRFLNSTK